jgi:hypothetical protein
LIVKRRELESYKVEMIKGNCEWLGFVTDRSMGSVLHESAGYILAN